MKTLMKKRISIFMALLMLLGAAVPGISVSAAKTPEYVKIYDASQQYQMQERVKADGYYYWIAVTYQFEPGQGYDAQDYKSADFSILRAKTKTGAGKVVYKSNGVCTKKIDGKKRKLARYEYLDIYCNGKYVIFGEQDVKTGKITYYRIGVNGKGKKKLASFANPNYHPNKSTKFSGSGILAVYKDSIYCQTPEKKGLRGNVKGYKVSVKNGKKTRCKALDTAYEKDVQIYCEGKYLYNTAWAKNAKAFSIKEGKQVKTLKAEAYGYSKDGGSLFGMINDRYLNMLTTKIYLIENNKTGEPVMDIDLSVSGESKVELGAINNEYIYLIYYTEPGNDNVRSYCRYSFKEKTISQISAQEWERNQ